MKQAARRKAGSTALGRPRGTSYTLMHKARARAIFSDHGGKIALTDLDVMLQREGHPGATIVSLARWTKGLAEPLGAAPLAMAPMRLHEMLGDMGQAGVERVVAPAEAERIAASARSLASLLERVAGHLDGQLVGIEVRTPDDLAHVAAAMASIGQTAIAAARAAQILREPSNVQAPASGRPPSDRQAAEQAPSPFAGLERSNFAEA